MHRIVPVDTGRAGAGTLKDRARCRAVAGTYPMKTVTAYFAGVATVLGAMAAGFAGALVLTGPTSSPPSSVASSGFEAKARAADNEAKAPTDNARVAGQPASAASNSPGPTPIKEATNQSAKPAPQSSRPASQSSKPASQSTASAPDSTDASDQSRGKNSYARASSADLEKYIHKRDRRWVRRHLRDEGDRQTTVLEIPRPPANDEQFTIESPGPRPFFGRADDDD